MVSLKKNLLVGVFVAAFIFVGSILLNFSFSYMGVSDKSATALIIRNYKSFLIIYHLKILLAYVGIGLIAGWFSWLLKISRRIPNILFQLFFWVMFWVRAVQIFPQLFLPQLFNRGGFFKGLQLFLTDVVPIALPEVLFAAVILGIALRKRRIVFGLAILLAAAGFIIKFKHVPVQAGSENVPNVLIFGTDSLRPQSISFNGYVRPTPNIDEVFSRGVHFRNTMASVARTFPVWTSVLTSTLPPEHGIRTMYPTGSDLKRRWLTLVDILNRKRYFTAVASDFVLQRVTSGISGSRSRPMGVRLYSTWGGIALIWMRSTSPSPSNILRRLLSVLGLTPPNSSCNSQKRTHLPSNR